MSSGDSPRPRGAFEPAPGGQPAQNLRDGLCEIARAMPTNLRTVEDVAEYRSAGATRTTTAREIAERFDLSTRELNVAAGCPVTVFSAADVGIGPAGMAREPGARVLFLHGGGMIAGCRFDGADVLARHARALDLEVWTLEYPLAPEHDLAAMVEAVLAVLEAAGAAGAAPVVLTGQSGGGGVAAASALAARDRGVRVDAQMLVCPMLDRRELPSVHQYAASPAWSAVSDTTAWGMALGRSGIIPPGEHEDLERLPPTFLDTGAAELFRDSVLGHAGRLAAAGVSTELHMYSGAFHSSDCVVEDARVSTDAHAARASWLGRMIRGEL